jgi:hypothetical protein
MVAKGKVSQSLVRLEDLEVAPGGKGQVEVEQGDVQETVDTTTTKSSRLLKAAQKGLNHVEEVSTEGLRGGWSRGTAQTPQ